MTAPLTDDEFYERQAAGLLGSGAPLDLTDPLADLGALYAAAQDAHNRGDEFATVCLRLIERLAEMPITHQHEVESLREQISIACQERDEARKDLDDFKLWARAGFSTAIEGLPDLDDEAAWDKVNDECDLAQGCRWRFQRLRDALPASVKQ